MGFSALYLACVDVQGCRKVWQLGTKWLQGESSGLLAATLQGTGCSPTPVVTQRSKAASALVFNAAAFAALARTAVQICPCLAAGAPQIGLECWAADSVSLTRTPGCRDPTGVVGPQSLRITFRFRKLLYQSCSSSSPAQGSVATMFLRQRSCLAPRVGLSQGEV